MSKNKSPSSTQPATYTHRMASGETLQMLGGSHFDAPNSHLVNQAANSLWYGNNPSEETSQELSRVAIFSMADIRPKDVLEGMLAAQMIATHNASMECFRRSMLSGQTFEGRNTALKHAARLTSSFTQLLDALNRHRGKPSSDSKVTVQNVNVGEGGQAIVGSVTTKREE